ncbi:1-deoxy-D-xylulose-5-phosphate reductoisomerase [Mobilitalea sibirica]|uniref:1-deoxy-D-xylulose 5-phosphate reductoisomerase n=1 Tax=Mobilitalea sibirica TaxID=1462919 RepID=A0A8J7H412_9FIRM|nr:1-deoxy-D-xylulose-5-phosphate reductoisomerase [Mobilitalea sibirica]MBH1942028.1 1-deoxy-D-xylulose-5-phosphate reductoisomerase [Mobilitalea sibirica]
MKKISVLGSTGSIGTQTMDIVRNKNDLKITALAAGSNIELLEQQIREFRPNLVCVFQEDKAVLLRENIRDLDTLVVTGMEGLIECATESEAETVVTAMVGMIGILPTIEGIKAGKNIALANKETLVTAGHIIMPLVKEKKVSLLPVDSEHSAIFQALNGEDKRYARQIILTASGGPFRGRELSELKNITPGDALKHPNWAMGQKITIDSATMINKGLEVMEAAWLFDINIDQIKVVIHPQSIIHSMVEYVDGSVLAQLGVPDMKLPIQYALFYPRRMEMPEGERVDFVKLKQLTFEEPDMNTFFGLKLGYEAGRIGGSMPTVYNAANEWAVARFLEGKIRFLDIPTLIGEAMSHHKLIQNPTLNEILNTEIETYDFVRGFDRAGLL